MTSAGLYWTREELSRLGLASFGAHVYISKSATIHHPGRVHIGDSVRIDDFCCLVASASIRIGSHVHLGTSVTINAVAGVTIGDYAGISAGTKVFTSNDDYGGDFLTGPTVDPVETNITVSPVVIGQHCIVGANSVILPGTVLHDGVAVGAMSLVKESLDAWMIYGGIPARPLRARSRALLERVATAPGDDDVA